MTDPSHHPLRRLIIVGGGPIGLETALRATCDGYDVTVFERGEIGAAVASWEHVRLFTPFSMNSSPEGRAATSDPVESDEILTGREYIDRYLRPLSEIVKTKARVLTGHQVVACSRERAGKGAGVGRPERGDHPFRVLVRNKCGEQIFHSERLIDCSGFITRHRWIGNGGMPCVGEQQVLRDHHYRIPDLLGADRSQFENDHTLVVGSGYSAATSLSHLVRLAATARETRVTWVTRGNRTSALPRIENDVLPERVQLTSSANAAAAVHPAVTWLPGRHVEAVEEQGGGYRVHLTADDPAVDAETQQFDHIIANTGFRPDLRPFEELQIHRCYASDGPMKLAAHLMGQTSGDCLQQTAAGPDLLKNPEPGFYLLGAAAYGRDSRFLLQNGIAQVRELFDHFRAVDSGE